MATAAERKALMKGLSKLDENMTTLAELSELAIRKAVDGFRRLDPGVAQEVFTLDNEVYGLQLEIEKTCIELIALHAPVARDLRMITTSLKITTDLDRIGRYAKDIAEVTLQFREAGLAQLDDPGILVRMADLTVDMVDTAIEAFSKRDADRVRRISQADDAVDELHDQAFRETVERMQAGKLRVETGARFILVSRYLERIADHAVNIGERVVYMVTGEQLPRIRAAERAKQEGP